MEIFDISIYESELISIKKEKISEIILPNISPNLTDKQKQAMQLALREGYYDFPKKIYLSELAKIVKTSRPAFQERLRKAEKKIIPLFFEEKSL